MHSATRSLSLAQVLALVLALALAACDRSGRACEQARIQLRKGDLERAEAYLAGSEGAEAESVRSSIERTREHRRRLSARIAELKARLPESSESEVRAELGGLLVLERDPVARELLEQAQSDFADAFAARPRRSIGLAELGSPGARPAGIAEVGEPAHTQQQTVARLRLDVEVALEGRAWGRAWRLLAMLEPYPELEPAEVEGLRALLLEGAEAEAARLLEGAAALEAEGTAGDALAFLERHRARFPREPAFGFFHDELAALSERAGGQPGASSGASSGAGEDAPRSELTRAQRDSLVRAFLALEGDLRASAWSSLQGLDDEKLTRAALDGCLERASAELITSPVLEDLARLADLRATLDERRAEALALIFDEQTYFFPYDPPEPPRQRADYVRAQREVSEAVAALRSVWETEFAVRLPAELRAAASDLTWCLEQARALGLAAELPPGLHDYVRALPPELESLTLREFAWSEREAEELRLGRRVRDLNERAFRAAESGVPGLGLAAIPDAEEREMVRLVGDYRAMFGLAPLAWNARLQAASQGHSDYMRKHARMGHLEDDPELRTVADRCARVGYRGVTAENCVHHEGGAGPAFTWWVHSSGHHRNLLLQRFSEVGVSSARSWWTQNLGDGDEYLEALGR